MVQELRECELGGNVGWGARGEARVMSLVLDLGNDGYTGIHSKHIYFAILQETSLSLSLFVFIRNTERKFRQFSQGQRTSSSLRNLYRTVSHQNLLTSMLQSLYS